MLVMNMRRSSITPLALEPLGDVAHPLALRNDDHRRGGERPRLVELHLDEIEERRRRRHASTKNEGDAARREC